MKTSKEELELYKKLDSLWVANGVTPANKLYKESRTSWGQENSRYENKLERVDFKVAKKFIQLALKKFCKPSVYRRWFKGLEYKQVSGRGHTWPRRKWPNQNSHFNINCDFGWAHIVHDLGHCIHAYNTDLRPHCAEHAVLELKLVKYCLENLFVEKSVEAIEVAMVLTDHDLIEKENIVGKNYRAAKKRLANNERLLKKYTSAVKSAQKRIKADQKKIAKYEKDNTPEQLEQKTVLVAKPQSPKQKCMSLVQEIEWLNIERDEDYTWRTVIDVLDKRKEYDWDIDSDYREWTHDSWKSAYEYACELVQAEKS